MKQLLILMLCLWQTTNAEIHQGTLRNGMQYYICPASEQFEESDEQQLGDTVVTLVIKKTKQLPKIPFDLPISISIKKDSLEQQKVHWESMQEFEFISYETGSSIENLEDVLESITGFMRASSFPENFSELIADHYAEIRKETKDAQEFWDLWEGDFSLADKLFSSREMNLKQLFEDFYDPARMAIIIEGNIYPTPVIELLENTAGQMSSTKTYMDLMEFKSKEPVAFSINQEGIGLELADMFGLTEEEIPENSKNQADLYFYPVPPSYRNHVLSDLVFLSQINQNNDIFDATVGRLRSLVLLPKFKERSFSEIDEDLFITLKEELKNFYEEDKIDFRFQCTCHFLSNIKSNLMENHENLLQELPTVTWEEFQSFMEKNLRHGIVREI